MLSKDDTEQLDKLLNLVKTSKDYDLVDVSYSKQEGWRINVYPHTIDTSDDYGYSGYTKERLGKLCLDKIAWLVQKKLGG
jgi:hypothetical protein